MEALSIHHVGARWGSRFFPVLDAFESDVINVMYDADPDCLPQAERRNQHLASELHVLPYCLAGQAGEATFGVAFDPNGSSLYQPNPDYADFYLPGGVLDYQFGEVWKHVETRSVRTDPLDDILKRSAAVPPPDFLSVDAQGAEFEVFTGARETLEHSVLGVGVETAFHPMYVGERTFGDVSALLSEFGLQFVRFIQIKEGAPLRAPAGMRARGLQLFADALYLRRIDDLERIEDLALRRVMLRKLAFIAIAFEQLEYGFGALEAAQDLGDDGEHAQTSYTRFLHELASAAKEMPRVFPPLFGEVYTSEQSRARYIETDGPPAPPPKRSLARRVGSRGRRLWRQARQSTTTHRETPIERVLRAYGLDALASVVADCRHRDEPYARGEHAPSSQL